MKSKRYFPPVTSWGPPPEWLLAMILLPPLPGTAQTFTSISVNLSRAAYGDVAWGDYDNDDDLDILLTGNASAMGVRPPHALISIVYRNDGYDVFENVSANLVGVSNSAVSWGDYDNDGDLDILLTGNSLSGVISKVYRNDGTDVFNDIGADLDGVHSGSVCWGDFDNDGDLDILLTGCDSTNTTISRVYQNNGAGLFQYIDAQLPKSQLVGVYRGSATWGDYDNDGDLDILLTGFDEADITITKVYRNDGNKTFTDIAADISGGISSSWGDYDNDGDLDILVHGSMLYQNDGNGIFTDISANIASLGVGSWGDSDNDGDLDILLIGPDPSKIYRNDGEGIFTDINADLIGVSGGAFSWCDYDNDGDLDILMTGLEILSRPPTGQAPTQRLYRNDGDVANTAPTAPSSLHSSGNGNSVTLIWDSASDSETASPGLSYNLRIGTTSDGSEIMSAHSSASGFRLIVAPGNVNHNTRWTLYGLQKGTYTWTVQAVDVGYMGSNFSPEQTFIVSGVPIAVGEIPVQLPGDFNLAQNYPNPFNPSTVIYYALPEVSDVSLSIYDLMGREIRSWRMSEQQPGYYSVQWSGGDDLGGRVASGIYICVFRANAFTDTKKMLLLK